MMFLLIIGTPFAQELLYSFQNRREKIMENIAMMNALFCDPRHMFILTSEERRIIKIRLIALFNRLKGDISIPFSYRRKTNQTYLNFNFYYYYLL